ncbi:MAG: hypothetical protein K2H02_02835 [Anaeroplasmataceae bacterium]|nr:hypothetical protein [Anaeroplasmataceae bacterium]
MKHLIKIFSLVFIGIISTIVLVSCGKKAKEDYSNLTFAEVFEIKDYEDKYSDGVGMPGMAMDQLTSTSSESAYPAQKRHIFELKAKYDVEITGASFSMKPEKEAYYMTFVIYPVPLNRNPIFDTTTDEELYLPISTGANVLDKSFSFTYTLKKGNSIQLNSLLYDNKGDWQGLYIIDATFYNFKLDFTVIE